VCNDVLIHHGIVLSLINRNSYSPIYEILLDNIENAFVSTFLIPCVITLLCFWLNCYNGRENEISLNYIDFIAPKYIVYYSQVHSTSV